MRINEIFYSIQGEGHFTGRPAVFVRMSGCNLRCSFCDTDFSIFTEMTEEEILEAVCAFPSRHIVLTGGEPTLQITSSLIDKLHQLGFFVQIETNGTRPLPGDCEVDWITCSPKDAEVKLEHIDELKVVYQGQDMLQYSRLEATEYYLQPCDTGDGKKNKEIIKATLDYILLHPIWSLSLQTQKILNIK